MQNPEFWCILRRCMSAERVWWWNTQDASHCFLVHYSTLNIRYDTILHINVHAKLVGSQLSILQSAWNQNGKK